MPSSSGSRRSTSATSGGSARSASSAVRPSTASPASSISARADDGAHEPFPEQRVIVRDVDAYSAHGGTILDHPAPLGRSDERGSSTAAPVGRCRRAPARGTLPCMSSIAFTGSAGPRCASRSAAALDGRRRRRSDGLRAAVPHLPRLRTADAVGRTGPARPDRAARGAQQGARRAAASACSSTCPPATRRTRTRATRCSTCCTAPGQPADGVRQLAARRPAHGPADPSRDAAVHRRDPARLARHLRARDRVGEQSRARPGLVHVPDARRRRRRRPPLPHDAHAARSRRRRLLVGRGRRGQRGPARAARVRDRRGLERRLPPDAVDRAAAPLARAPLLGARHRALRAPRVARDGGPLLPVRRPARPRAARHARGRRRPARRRRARAARPHRRRPLVAALGEPLRRRAALVRDADPAARCPAAATL